MYDVHWYETWIMLHANFMSLTKIFMNVMNSSDLQYQHTQSLVFTFDASSGFT